ncbi:MAG: GNAT family N-acetyltransferase [Acidimicrobiia bacterium]
MHPPPDDPPLRLRAARWVDIDPVTAYRLAALRSAVFVVEQQCPYLDLDGRDLEAATTQLWFEAAGGQVVAALRVMAEAGGGWRIGRVVTDPAHRAAGLARRLLEQAMAGRTGPFVLDAQSYLTEWYGRFGFVVDGPAFVEDGIPHTPMRRP